MRTLTLFVLVAGCLGSYTAPTDPAPLSSTDLGRVSSAQSNSDLAAAPSTPPNPSMPPASADMAYHDGGMGGMRDMTVPPGSDLATNPGAFGAPCAVAGDCTSGLCESFGGTLLCTKACTSLGNPDPNCPNGGMCNRMGYCRP
jgi:hypothetical protein